MARFVLHNVTISHATDFPDTTQPVLAINGCDARMFLALILCLMQIDDDVNLFWGHMSGSNVSDLIGHSFRSYISIQLLERSILGVARNEVQTGLTIGSDYYAQTDGTITTASALLLHSLLAQPLAQPKLI